MHTRNPSVSRRTFLAAAAGVTASAAFSAPAFAQPRRGRNPVLPWDEIAPGVVAFVVGPTGGNVIAAKGPGATLVVDTKFAYVANAIRDDASIYGGGAPIRVVNTHHHADHTGGNLAFVGRDEVHAHRNAVERVRGQIERYQQGARAAMRQAVDLRESGELDADITASAEAAAERAEVLRADDYVPTQSLPDGLTSVEDIAADLHHFGHGHTDNDIVVHLSEVNVVHTGDLVFDGLHPFFDVNAGANVFGWIASLWRIYNLCDAKTVVVPGHGPVGSRATVRRMIRYHEQLIESVGDDLDRGVPKADAQAKTYPWMEGLEFDRLRPIAIGAVYDDLAARR